MTRTEFIQNAVISLAGNPNIVKTFDSKAIVSAAEELAVELLKTYYFDVEYQDDVDGSVNGQLRFIGKKLKGVCDRLELIH